MTWSWFAGLLSVALLVAVVELVRRSRKPRSRKPSTPRRAPTATHRSGATSWVAGGAVAGTTAWWPGQSEAQGNDTSSDGDSSSSCGGCGGGCGGCGG